MTLHRTDSTADLVPERSLAFRAAPPPPADADLRQHLLQAELSRSLLSPPDDPGRLVVVEPDRVQWATLRPLEDLPAAGTVMLHGLVQRMPRARGFRIGWVPGACDAAVLELDAAGSWWLAVWAPHAAAWSEQTGSGPLPTIIERWWPTSPPRPDLRLVARRLDDIEVPQRARATLVADTATDAVVTRLGALADPESDRGFTLVGHRLTAWRLPDHHVGGPDEALRMLAHVTGASMVGRLRALTPPIYESILERHGERLAVLLHVEESSASVIERHALGTVDDGESWLRRPPIDGAAQLGSLVGSLDSA